MINNLNIFRKTLVTLWISGIKNQMEKNNSIPLYQ